MLKKFLFLWISLACILLPLHAQNYKFQSLFIYNIIKRIEWPSESEKFIIGVLDCKELQKELVSISQKQKIGGRSIEVINVNMGDSDLSKVHVLYVGRSASSKIPQLKTKIADKPILLIGEKPGINGVGINFLDNSTGIKFEIFTNEIKSHKLLISNSLLNLGIVKN